MKPRRWYSSPEFNPQPRPPQVRPRLNDRHLMYVGKVRVQPTPVLKARRRWKPRVSALPAWPQLLA